MTSSSSPIGMTVRDAEAHDTAALQALFAARAINMPIDMPIDMPATSRRLVAQASDGRLLATLQLNARIGLTQPRYWFHVGLVVHAAAALGLVRPQRTLLLCNDLTGAAELGHIAWHDAAALAPLVSAAQALVAAESGRYGESLIVELPGVRDALGQHPFWQGLGRHFYGGELQDTATRAGPEWRSHVAVMLPRHLIYASFLPDTAQTAIASCAAYAEPLRQVLHARGMQWRGHVGVVDGAAVMAWTPGA